MNAENETKRMKKMWRSQSKEEEVEKERERDKRTQRDGRKEEKGRRARTTSDLSFLLSSYVMRSREASRKADESVDVLTELLNDHVSKEKKNSRGRDREEKGGRKESPPTRPHTNWRSPEPASTVLSQTLARSLREASKIERREEEEGGWCSRKAGNGEKRSIPQKLVPFVVPSPSLHQRYLPPLK